MKALPLIVVSVACMSLLGSPASGQTIEVVPSAATAFVGGTISVDVVASGLGANMSPSIGAFDIDVGFDPAILAPAGVSFGSFLGVVGTDALSSSSNSIGNVNVTETSLLAAASLNTLQPASFTLVTLTFNVIAKGTSPVQLSLNALADENGSALGASTANANIASVNLVGAPVLSPHAMLSLFLLLLAAGLRPLVLNARPANRAR